LIVDMFGFSENTIEKLFGKKKKRNQHWNSISIRWHWFGNDRLSWCRLYVWQL
jgi:hypothetical protein